MKLFQLVCFFILTPFAFVSLGCGTSGQTEAVSSTASAANNTASTQATSPAEVQNAKTKLVGKWNGTVEIIPQGVELARTGLADDEEKKARFENYIENFKTTTMTLDLKEDATMEMTVSVTVQGKELSQPSAGTWDVEKVEGDNIVVKFVRNEDSFTEAQQFSFQSNDDFITEGPGEGAFRGIAQMRFSRLR